MTAFKEEPLELHRVWFFVNNKGVVPNHFPDPICLGEIRPMDIHLRRCTLIIFRESLPPSIRLRGESNKSESPSSPVLPDVNLVETAGASAPGPSIQEGRTQEDTPPAASTL